MLPLTVITLMLALPSPSRPRRRRPIQPTRAVATRPAVASAARARLFPRPCPRGSQPACLPPARAPAFARASISIGFMTVSQ